MHNQEKQNRFFGLYFYVLVRTCIILKIPQIYVEIAYKFTYVTDICLHMNCLLLTFCILYMRLLPNSEYVFILISLPHFVLQKNQPRTLSVRDLVPVRDEGEVISIILK